MAESRWAIVKCRFLDDESDTLPDAAYERLFTGAGAGTGNMVDYFRDVSHGELDLSRSQVFGWYTLSLRKADYAGNVDPSTLIGSQVNRWGLYNACRAAAEAAGVRLSDYVGVVATMNRGGPWPDGSEGVDLWGAAGGAVFCDRFGLTQSLMAHEMSHGYGLKHARRHGSTNDYQDMWDAMSTANSFMERHPEYQWIGPGVSAANMQAVNWFDESRLWRLTGSSTDVHLQLRPVHRHDLSGILAIEIPDPEHGARRWLLEFRNKLRWDAAVPEPALLIHYLSEGHSYLVPGPAPGRDHLIAGDILLRGDPAIPFTTYLRIEVQSIDSQAETCNLHLAFRRGYDPVERFGFLEWNQIVGGIRADGGGIIIRPGGGVVPVGPWDPTLVILENLATLHAVKDVRNTAARDELQRSALRSIIDVAAKQLSRLDPIQVPDKANKFGRFE